MPSLGDKVGFLSDAVSSLAEMDDFKAQYAKSLHAKMSRLPEMTPKRSSDIAAAQLARVIEGSGWKAIVFNADAWGISAVTLDIGGTNIPVSIGVQTYPGQKSFHIQVQQPMSGNMSTPSVDGNKKWGKLKVQIAKCLEDVAASKKLAKYGSVSLDVLGGKHPQLWVYTQSEEKFRELLPVFPKAVGRFAQRLAQKFARNSHLFIGDEER